MDEPKRDSCFTGKPEEQSGAQRSIVATTCKYKLAPSLGSTPLSMDLTPLTAGDMNLCVCVCVYVCVVVCVCVRVCLHMCVYIACMYVCLFVSACMQVWLCTCTWVCLC